MNLTKIKKNFKKIIGFVASAAILSVAIFPTMGMRADSPRFNFLTGDLEMLRGANVSQNEKTWKDPVQVNAGETFDALIYYHNGIVDTIAENTVIKANVPAESAAGSAKITASISADNAETVSDTVVDGQIVGLSGLTINLDRAAKFEIVPGSVLWYPNSGLTPKVTAPLLENQTGNELFSSKGLSIGDINGCWEYAGFVKFTIKTTPITHKSLDIEKTVKKADSSDEYTESVSILSNEAATFKVETRNTGDTILDNVVISDKLPSGLNVVADSAKIVKGGIESPINTATFFGAGENIGLLAVNESVTVTFDVQPEVSISDGSALTNEATAISGDLYDKDTASVIISSTIVQINKSKSAYNNTQKVDATKVLARAGDEITYTLNTSNTGNIATMYTVSDEVSDVMEYADIVSISDGGELIGSATSGGATDAKLYISYPEVEIDSMESIIRTFTVQVKSPLPQNPQDGYHYDYQMYNVYGNAISIFLEKPEIPVEKNPCLSIQKLVRNISNGEIEFVDANTAYAGDTLEYKIVFKNTGNGPADYVKIWDVLPSNVSIDTSAAAILGMGGSEKSIAENITLGYVVKTIAAGEEGYIRFRVIISSQIAAGEFLTNTAYLNDDSTISDTASTVIKEKAVLASAAAPSLPRTGSANTIVIALAVSLILSGCFAYAYEKIKY